MEIQRLRKRKEVTQDSVRGSNPEFPYQPQNFRIQGTRETMKDRNLMDEEDPNENAKNHQVEAV